MRNLCAQCNICSFTEAVSRGESEEKLSRDVNGVSPLVLVIADARNEGVESLQLMHLDTIFSGLPFTYTRVVRCEQVELSDSQQKEAVSRCAVWTHHLLRDRAFIITVPKGLQQMGIEGKNVGDLFKSQKYGIVLVVDRFSDISSYRDKIQRALREVGLDE